ncbi:MAG: reverse transcriptase family protein [Saccharospirillum sp.]|nr:reverse transcriptase family protein [Saccharospirillum sp.]
MSDRSFEQAFNAIFHSESEFSYFCNLKLEAEVTPFTINGRQIYPASESLKRYLKFIDKVILRYLAKNESVVHSFVKGKSTLTAVQAHVSNKYFFITDIQDFYFNIKANDVRRILNRDRRLIPISDFQDYIELVTSMTTFDGVVPVGFPTSPQLSNAFLFEFDSVLKKYCDSRSLTYTRYADDIIISGQSYEVLSNLKKVVQDMLTEFASPVFLLNLNKTRITQLGNKVKILGLVIMPNGKITIDSKYKSLIETLLHFYVSDKKKYEDLLRKTMNGKEQSLFGLLHYARSIDTAYIEKLQKKYGVYALRSLMEEKKE